MAPKTPFAISDELLDQQLANYATPEET